MVCGSVGHVATIGTVWRPYDEQALPHWREVELRGFGDLMRNIDSERQFRTLQLYDGWPNRTLKTGGRRPQLGDLSQEWRGSLTGERALVYLKS